VTEKPGPGRMLGALGWVVTGCVIAAAVAGLVISGGPGRARQEHADEQRVSDLGQIETRIQAFYANRHRLPVDGKEAFSMFGPERTTDPETKRPYEYRVVDKTHFELCATFDLDYKADRSDYYGGDWDAEYGSDFSLHKAGHQCFTLPAKGAN